MFISGSSESLLQMLEKAFSAGYHEGTGDYYSDYDYLDFWEEFKKEHLTEFTQEDE